MTPVLHHYASCDIRLVTGRGPTYRMSAVLPEHESVSLADSDFEPWHAIAHQRDGVSTTGAPRAATTGPTGITNVGIRRAALLKLLGSPARIAASRPAKSLAAEDPGFETALVGATPQFLSEPCCMLYVIHV